MKNQNIIIAEITYTLLCQHDSVVKVHNQSIALHNRPQDSRHETKQPDIMLARIPFHTTPFSVAYAIRRYRIINTGANIHVELRSVQFYNTFYMSNEC